MKFKIMNSFLRINIVILFVILITSSIENSINTMEMDSERPMSLSISLGPMDQNSQSRARQDIRYWATFQFDYHNTGNTSGKAPNTNNTLWKFKCKGEIYGSPAVVGNSVYFTATDGFLYNIDLINGTQTWRYDLSQNSYATPTVFGGNIYVGSGTENQNNNNNLFCIDGSNGGRLWSYPVDGPIIGSPIIINRPGNLDDRVYFGTIKDNKVYSLDLATKQLDWDHSIGNGNSGSSDGIWGSLAYYNIENGWLLYSVNSESFDLGATRGLFCIKAEDSSERWQFLPSEGSSIIRSYSSPTIFQDRVLIGMGLAGTEYSGKLYCLDINNGVMIWNFTTEGGGFGYGVTTSPAVAYNKILFGSCDGKMYALDYNGKQLWNFTTGDNVDGIYSSPAVADNKVYFGSTDNVFYCLNVHNGSLIWKYDLESDGPKGTYGAVSAPAIAYNKVLMGGNNGYLYCFGSLGTEPPTIQIKKPLDQAIVKDLVEISGVADDDIDVTLVQVKIDDGNWINTTGKYIWQYSWDTTSFSNGPHTIYARAYDKDGFVLTNISVIVNNGNDEMLVLVTSHFNGQIVGGVTKFQGTAYHSTKDIAEVQINIDNSTVWTVVTGTRFWYFNWDTTEYIDGEYFIQFRAFDGENFSIPINLIINVSNFENPSLQTTPMFRANRGRTGIYKSAVPNSSNIIWNFTTENQIESSPVYYNGNIFFGADDYYLYCLNGKTGALIWKYETANQVRSTPVIADKRLYVGSQDYYMYCLGTQEGNLIWRTRTGGSIDSSPLILNETLIFGSYDGKVYCLNTSDGSKRWRFETDGEIWASPAYWDNCVYVGSLDGKMYCIWANNGTQRWNFSSNTLEQSHGIYDVPAIIGNKVIFGSEDTYVYCVDSTNGNLIWKFKTTGFVYSSPAVNNSRVFISSLEEKNDGILYALPLEDPNSDSLIAPNEVLWKFKTHDFDGGSSPIVSTVSGKVLIGSNAGEAGGIGMLYCFDEVTGELYWNFTTNGDIHGTALLANGLVYIGSLDEKMYCLGYLNGSGNGANGNPNDKNKSQIFVSIKISTNEVLSGHAIENILVKVTTKNGTPIPQTWVVFELEPKIGALSDYYGTVFENGTYTFSFIAPTVGKIRYVNLTVTASKFGLLNGTNLTTIMVKPLEESGKSKDDDDLFTEIIKPKYLFLWIIIITLITLTLIIFSLVITVRKKVRNLEEGIDEKKHQEKEKEEGKQRIFMD